MRLLFCFLSFVGVCCGQGVPAPVLAPPAAWVDELASPALAETPAAHLSYGYDYFLLDRQVNVAAREDFSRNVYRLTSESTLGSGARLTWSFDPSYETLALHHIRVIRDGVVQERLKEGLVQVIQQERDLDRHMLNGRLTALVLLDDVRVGDVIDYSSSLRGANPVFNGHYMDAYTTGWGVPVRHYRIRVITPESRALTQKTIGASALSLSTTKADGNVIHTWEGRALPIVSSEDEQPSWFTSYPFLQLTEFNSWAGVAAWAVPLYALPETVPETVSAKAAELTKNALNDDEKTVALLKFVQQEIRYLGLELGPGTHRPNPPADVLARRFGDCKDKTLLFCALMRAAGLEAKPALVNTTYRHRIGEWVASPYAFDHVIARVTRPHGDAWWVDPTLSHQEGGPLHRGLPDYRLALVVDARTDSLEPVIRPQSALRKIEVEEEFNVTGFDQPADFKVVTRYHGLSAENIRRRLAQTSVEETTKDYVNYYTTTYPGVTSARPVSWRDQPDANIVTVEEHYRIPELWKTEKNDTLWKANFYPQPISDYAAQPSTRVRTQPLHVNYPLSVSLTTRVNLHEDWSVTPSETKIEDHAFRASDSITGSGRLVTMNYRWETLADHVPADKTAGHVAALTRFREGLGYHLTYNKTIAAQTAAATATPKPFRFNWLVVVIFLVCAVVAFWAGRRLYARPPVAPPPLPGPGETNLIGIGGWLVLVALGVFLRPVMTARTLLTDFSYVYDLDRWEAITLPGTEFYQAALGPLVIGAMIGNVLLFCFGLVLAVLFFKRKRAFPMTFIAIMVATVVFVGADSWAAANLVTSAAEPDSKGLPDTLQALIQCAIWVPYMLLSRRVNLTFTR